jgi:hypothetical protein
VADEGRGGVGRADGGASRGRGGPGQLGSGWRQPWAAPSWAVAVGGGQHRPRAPPRAVEQSLGHHGRWADSRAVEQSQESIATSGGQLGWVCRRPMAVVWGAEVAAG